jgi:hypothetical protein
VPQLAREPDLLAAIQQDIAAGGLVGEEDAALLVYLAYSSRKLNKPLNVIIKGPSGSGKDEVQRRPADLMPPEDVKDLMSITPQALYYNEPGWLQQKILLGGERSHQDDEAQRDRTAAVRQMLSHGYITKSTVGEGLKGREIRQDGPISYSETTTQDSIFREDANRCLQVNTNPSTKLTRQVLRAQGQRYQPGQDAADKEAATAKQRHHEFQRALKYVDVRIPYQRTLADLMPVGKIEVRRLFNHVLALIEVIAYLHQHQRSRNQWDQLEATVEDYAVARRLVLGPLHTAIGLGHDFDKCVDLYRKLPQGGFTSTQAAGLLGANSRKVCHLWLGKLAEVGLIQCVEASASNRPARWKTTGKNPDELLLPSVATVRTALLRFRGAKSGG